MVLETARSVCVVPCLPRGSTVTVPLQRLGFGALYDGAIADYFITRADIVHAVPDSIPDSVAALTEPYCVAYNAVVERTRVRPGDTVSVIGPGPVGAFAAQIALVAGAAHVVCAGLPGDEPRLTVAKTYGASTLVSDEPWWTFPEHASQSDVVIDASGVSASLEVALGLVRAGGQTAKVGWGPEPYDRPLDLLVAKAVELHGAFSHTWATWERVLRLLSQGRLAPGPAVQAYDFVEWEEGFSAMASRRILKAVLTL